MKRIVSVAAGIFIALFITFLGFLATEEINRYNENMINSVDKPDVVLETQETNIWDYIREFNESQTEENETSDGDTDIGQTEHHTTETSKRYSPREDKKTEVTTIETGESEVTTEQTKITIIVT